MSNLLKSVYFNVNRDNKVIIDSNKKKIGTPVQPPQDVLKAIPGFDFVPGVNVLNIEQIVQEEQEKKPQSDELLREARKQAEDIMAKAKKEAETAKERVRQEAFDQGYSEGMGRAKEEGKRLEESLNAKMRDMTEEYVRQMDGLEPAFAELTAKLVEKITGIMMESHKDAILHVLGTAMRDAPKSDRFTIQASKEDIYYLETKKEELKHYLIGEATLHLVENEALTKNQCIIEMDGQILDCSLDVQLQTLRDELRILALEDLG